MEGHEPNPATPSIAASYHISTPERFNFTQPEEWPKWIRRFERFREASGLSAKSEKSQVNTLIYTMGDEADDILSSFGLEEDQKTKYNSVKEAFQNHFIKKRNPIYERAKFNQRKQEEGESVDTFITALHTLAKHCEYGALQDQMIRDRLVVGLRDSVLSEKLQMEPDLSLEKAVSYARQREAVKKQQSVVRGETHPNVDVVHAHRHYNKVKPQTKKSLPRVSTSHPVSRKESPKTTCTRCGQSPYHNRDRCPARDAVCHRCKNKGHYKSQCRTKVLRVITTEPPRDPDDDDIFIAAVHQHKLHNPWIATLQVNELPISFKIDTGADVSVLPESTFTQLKDVRLKPSSKCLAGPDKQALSVCGQFTATCTYGEKKIQEDFFVVKDLQTALVGRPAIEALDLVSRVNSVQPPNVLKKFPQIFQGLGKMEGEYHIKLRDGAVPFAQTTPRRVALPLKPKVKAELEWMEKMGVISRVEEPTDWCAAMVVVPKADNKVRICVDLTKLSESVQRERHLLPSVEQTLGQLAGAKIFTKLDANSGFWQIPLSHESSLLTTFITPFGRFCFNRLPFGITSAPEHFQRRMSEILVGIEGVVCMVDDILVSGNTQIQHDQRLETVLDRLARAGVTLNADKCVFSQSSVRFLGQIVDAEGIRPDPQKIKAACASNARAHQCDGTKTFPWHGEPAFEVHPRHGRNH